jgi:hypothetical protein
MSRVPAVDTVLVKFGSWQALVRRGDRRAIRAWTADHGGTLPRPTDRRRGGHPDWIGGTWPSGSTVKARYGTREAALAAASSPPAPPRP